MKIAATVVLFVATLCVADRVFSSVSVGDTVRDDFLNLEAPSNQVTPEVTEGEEAEEFDNWIDTIRRRRTRRQSRFC